jgi:hypothetical protein
MSSMSRTASTHPARIVKVLLERHGHTFCEELGIDLGKGTPTALFRWLCDSLLFSKRINTDRAARAARALSEQGWNNASKMHDAGWERRTHVLNRAGYARYDESTSRRLGQMADLLTARYGGDLRKLRERADRDPGREQQLLLEFKGIGPVGVDIFCREAQLCWPELYPFADRKSLGAARKLGLPASPQALADLINRRRFPALLAALVRADLAKAHREIAALAAG